MYITTFNFIFTSTNKLVGDVLTVVNAWQIVYDGKFTVRNQNLNVLLRQIGVICSIHPNSFHGRSIIAARHYPYTEPICRMHMHSDTTIEEHHHNKVFCYMTLVYNVYLI